MLQVQKLTAGYGPVEVLHGISLHVDAEEIVSVLGPNGAGKSTLLRTLAGLLRPRRGAVRFDGQRIGGEAPEDILRRGIALVPEGRRIFPGLTVLENLRMGAYLEQRRELVKERVSSIFERFPVLGERRYQLGGTLSGGEQQQLAIARALMSEPKMLLLDEPSLGLAPLLVQDIFDILRTINGRGTTILLVEQNIHQALKVSDRAYVLASGTVQLEGDAAEFKASGLERAYLGDE